MKTYKELVHQFQKVKKVCFTITVGSCTECPYFDKTNGFCHWERLLILPPEHWKEKDMFKLVKNYLIQEVER